MRKEISIGIIGDYQSYRPSHIATNDSLKHCADYLGIKINIEWLPTHSFEDNDVKRLSNFDGLWCAPGEYLSSEGAIYAIKYAREHNLPFIATCQGFQHAVIEYARNKLGFKDVQHMELNPDATELIITALSCSFVGESRKVYIKENSRIYSYYNAGETTERFTCNFGINPYYRKQIDDSGFKIVGIDENDEVRLLDLDQNKFYIASLFEPQLSSQLNNPHRLILTFLSYTRNLA